MTHVKPWLYATALALTLHATGHAADKVPERRIEGTTITSERDPAVTITLPQNAVYVGATRWDLYEVADCELILLVEADEQRRVQRLYWVQFEAYLPSNTHAYTYKFAEKTAHAGREWDVATHFGPTSNTPKPTGDGAHMRELLKKAGYSLAPEAMNVRLVTLLDDARRKELMIIYGEDLSLSGTTVAELGKPGNEAKWSSLKSALIERAKENVHLQF